MSELQYLTYENGKLPDGLMSAVYSGKFLVGDAHGDAFCTWEHYKKKEPQYLPTAFVNEESLRVAETTTFFQKNSPFTQENLLDYREDKVQELIFRMRTLRSDSCKELEKKLLALLTDVKEEDTCMDLDSLRDLYNFFQLNRRLKCPMISLTPENEIYASWKPGGNRVFSVRFLGKGKVRFVIFKPNDMHREQQMRLSGTATYDMLENIASPHGVWDWISA